MVVFMRMFVLFFLPSGRKPSLFYLSKASVRDGKSDLDSPEVHRPRRRLIGPGRVPIRGDGVSCERVGFFLTARV